MRATGARTEYGAGKPGPGEMLAASLPRYCGGGRSGIDRRRHLPRSGSYRVDVDGPNRCREGGFGSSEPSSAKSGSAAAMAAILVRRFGTMDTYAMSGER